MILAPKSLELLLSVGTPAVVVVQPDNPTGPRYLARLSGWKRGEFLVFDCLNTEQEQRGKVKSPLRRVPVVSRQDVIIRFIIDGEVCAFREMVLETLHLCEVPHFVLRWPTRFESVRIRKDERFAAAANVTLVTDEGAEYHGQTADLSSGGCGIYIDANVKVNTAVSLAIRLADGSVFDDIIGQVRYVREYGEKRVRLGVLFLSVPDSVSRELAVHLRVLRASQSLEADTSDTVLVLTEPAEKDSYLHNLGLGDIDVIYTHDVAEFFYRIRAIRPRAALIDCRQKNWSGIDVCAHVRSNPRLNHVKLVLAGVSPVHIDAATRLLGADSCVPDSVHETDRIRDAVLDVLRKEVDTSAVA